MKEIEIDVSGCGIIVRLKLMWVGIIAPGAITPKSENLDTVDR